MSKTTSAARLPDNAAARAVTVNGEICDTTAVTLDRLLSDLGYGGRKIATARNGEFVPEAQRATTELASGDRIEIVAPRQGG